jgi:hypothetical protein
MASAGLIVGGVVSAGGLTAVVVKIFSKDKQKTNTNISELKEQ